MLHDSESGGVFHLNGWETLFWFYDFSSFEKSFNMNVSNQSLGNDFLKFETKFLTYSIQMGEKHDDWCNNFSSFEKSFNMNVNNWSRKWLFEVWNIVLLYDEHILLLNNTAKIYGMFLYLLKKILFLFPKYFVTVTFMTSEYN